MDQRSPVIKLAVFGAPVSQSRSPLIHSLFAGQFGLKIDYRAIEATAADFADQVQALADQGGLGCNITAPFKSLAWQLAQRHSPSAQRAGTANTLYFDRQADWYADNTDGRGLLRDMANRCAINVAGKRVCILGAGGATAGILGELLEHTPATVVIANRTLERAQNMVSGYGEQAQAIALTNLDQAESFDLVINATSMGHSGEQPGLPLSLLKPDGVFYDLNYGPAAEPLRTFCDESEIPYWDGLGMLVEQAALSFELWTGKMPDTQIVMRALREE